MSFRRTLIVMLKEPRPGRVKTRLGRDIGMTRAAWWFRHQSARALRRLRDPRWQIVLAVTPDRDGMASRIWPADLPRIPQGGGDLGQRMLRAINAAPPGPVCLIGADIPGVSRAHLWHAFDALRGADVVFGPATDGGYWLIGAHHRTVLRGVDLGGVRWSSEHALSDTLARVGRCRVVLANRLSDVDTAADLKVSRM